MTSVPPPPLPLLSTGSSATTFRRDEDLVAALARLDAAAVFFFFAADDARAEAPRPAMRLTVGLVASSELFFFAIPQTFKLLLTDAGCGLLIASARTWCWCWNPH